MDFIISLFIYLNLITFGQTVDQTMIDANQAVIEQYRDDEDFLKYYESQNSSESVVTAYVDEW